MSSIEEGDDIYSTFWKAMTNGEYNRHDAT